MIRRRRSKSNGNDCNGSSCGNSYAVGYSKPPKHSQFRPGQSGNPAGRRKGVRNLGTDVKRTLATPVRVKENGRTRKKSTQESALMVLREKALRGDTRALDRLLDLAARFNNDAEPGQAPQLPAHDQAILAAYSTECAAAAAGADPTPKPDVGSGKKAPK